MVTLMLLYHAVVRMEASMTDNEEFIPDGDIYDPFVVASAYYNALVNIDGKIRERLNSSDISREEAVHLRDILDEIPLDLL